MSRPGRSSVVIILIVVVLLVIGLITAPILLIGTFLAGKLDKSTGSAAALGVCATVQEPYVKIFQDAGTKFGVQPAFVGAIFVGEHRSVKDTQYKTWPAPEGPWATSPKGANGPFQFLLSTWAAYQQDGNGDGSKDVQDLTDAAFAAAYYLSQSGAGNNTIEATDLQNAASRYNSGKPWSEGQQIKETSNYVSNLVMPSFQSFYCPTTLIAGVSGTFDPTGAGVNGVPIYRQGDGRYATYPVGGKEFSEWGCFPTSAAMIMRYYGAPVDPIVVGQLTHQGGYYAGAGTIHGNAWLEHIGAPYGLTGRETIDVGGGQNWDRVIALLKDKKPLIARGNGGIGGNHVKPYTIGGHGIVLTGYDERTNSISVNNPSAGLGDGPFPVEHLKKYTTVVYYLGR